jgi:hypothetical protein
MAVNGNYLGLYVGGQRIALTKSNDFSQKVATEDMTTKDSQGFKEVLPTLKEASCSMEGICTANLTNYLQWPEAFNNAIWVKGGTGSISGTKVANNDEQLLAQVLTWGTGTAISQTFVSNDNLIETNTIYFSIWLKGSGTVTIEVGDSASASISSTITLTSNWVRHSISFELETAYEIYVKINKVSGTTVSLFGPQLEKNILTAYKGSTETLRDLQTIAENRTKVSLLYSDYFSNSFTTAYEGFITDVSVKNAHDSISTFTCNFQSTGSTTITTI